MKRLRDILGGQGGDVKKDAKEKDAVVMRGLQIEARRARLEKELQVAMIRLKSRE